VRRVATAESIAIEEGAAALIARHATGSFRDALGTLEQLVTYAGDAAVTPDDVLSVLGVADVEQLFAAVDAIVARDAAAALRAGASLASSGRDPGQVLRDLEAHARELLTVQILGEVPAELRVTAERDQRIAQQAQTLAQTDAVRLLELVSAALEATANGAQPHIQLQLVLIKAAAPEMDPSMSALLARIEKLEQGGLRPVPAPEPVSEPEPVWEPEPEREFESLTSEPAAAEVTPVVSEVPPPSAVEPVATGSPTNGTPTEASDINRVWPAVIELVRGGNAMLGVLLESARPTSMSERELVLSFPAEAAFYKRKAEQDDYRRTTAEAVRNVTGMALTLRYELAETPLEPVESEPLAEIRPMSDDELVQRFVDEFGAEEILEDDPEGES
jgi:DNA polymerase-3 subunit gamma/tau